MPKVKPLGRSGRHTKMVELEFPDTIQRILCLGAHCDDIEIGCGGTILQLIRQNNDLEIYWIVFSSDPDRKIEANQSAGKFLNRVQKKNILLKDFRDGFFPYEGMEIKESFETLKQEVAPDLIFTHYRHDLHQDHRLISELTWNTFRDHLILEYEIPKYDGDLGIPNVFVQIDELVAQNKVNYILDSYISQKKKPWFTEDTFFSILRLRGVESSSLSKYAEAFYGRKLNLV